MPVVQPVLKRDRDRHTDRQTETDRQTDRDRETGSDLSVLTRRPR